MGEPAFGEPRSGGPEDAISRMARWDALRRRTEEMRAAARSPVDDLVEAIEAVVRRHPGLTVTVVAQRDHDSWQVRVGWAGPEVQTEAARVEEAPPPRHTAARLADLLRENPSLLDPPRE